MKNLFYLLIVLTIFSCSSSDDDNNNNNSDNNAFHPPTWIHGSWSFDEEIINGFKFTDDIFCSTYLTNVNCFLTQETPEYIVDEEISDTNYEFTIILKSNGQVIQTNTYHFIKIDSDHIYFEDPSIGNRTMYKMD